MADGPVHFTFGDCTPTELTFLTILNSMQEGIHTMARVKGFWEGDMDQPLSKLMLIVTEVAEMAEAYRKPALSDKLPGFTLQEEEAADILIRLLDLGGRDSMRIGLATLAKMRYNSKREYQHGGKLY